MSVLTTAMPAPRATPLAQLLAKVEAARTERPRHRAHGLALIELRPTGCGGRHCGHCAPLPSTAPMPPAASDHPHAVANAARAALRARHGA